MPAMNLTLLAVSLLAPVAQEAPPQPRAAASRAIVHVASLPDTLFKPFEVTAEARRILLEVHDSLLRRDLATGELVPAAARSFREELREDGGLDITFELRDGVRWHTSRVPGYGAREPQLLDAADVAFSLALHRIDGLSCPATAALFEHVTACVQVDSRTVRFECSETSSYLLARLGLSLPLTPAHLYDLTDPDHPRHAPDADSRARAAAIRDNPHNAAWVGLGPYQVVSHGQQVIEARRFLLPDGQPGYYDLARSGKLDVLRWREIKDDATARRALIEGELDMFERLSTDEFTNPGQLSDDFEARFALQLRWLPNFGYVGWNTRRPQLADVRVRRALALAVDLEAYLASNYRGLARRVSGPAPYGSPDYDGSVAPPAHSRAKAVELLEDAGWYDRDGDEVVDHEGVPLRIELLIAAGGAPALTMATYLQEAFRHIGVRLDVTPLDGATLSERLRERAFDAHLGFWVLAPDFDPSPFFHSKYALAGGFNHSGIDEDCVDACVDLIRRSLGPAARHAAWHDLHRRLAEDVVPYLYLFQVPLRCAVDRELHGVEVFPQDPGYELRSWWR
jgi:ABC-type transport system substrate-binding protein